MRMISSNPVDLKIPEKRFIYFLSNTLRYLVLALKYSLLLVLLFFLAGHERANPKIGNTTIEFFSAEFKRGILLDIKNINTDSYEEYIEKKLIYLFYAGRQYQPAWTLNYETNDHYEDFSALAETAGMYGLFSSLYMTEQIASSYAEMHDSSDDMVRLNARIKLERATTVAVFRMMIHLAAGLGEYDTSGVFMAFVDDLPAYLNYHIGHESVQAGIRDLQPKSVEYVRLQHALEGYLRKTASDTIQCRFPEFEKNDSLILLRLVSQGYITDERLTDSSAVSAAIKEFQKIHCLKETGRMNKQTIRALSISARSKFYQIALNLNRLRKDELKNKNSIVVNIPEFRLHYYDNKGNQTLFNIIVGKQLTPTPILTSEIKRIIANPYWTVPKSITHDELIPKIREDSTFLIRNGFSVIDKYENPVNASSIDWSEIEPGEFDYWIRQKNSRYNALGVVKFLFPNKYNVYLHDTQSKKLFSNNIRAYSHGCIRVQNPEELAQMILSSNSESEEEININSIIRSRKMYDISLDEPVSIFIRYYTCTADNEGNIYFHPDIYSRDKKEIEELIRMTDQV